MESVEKITITEFFSKILMVSPWFELVLAICAILGVFYSCYKFLYLRSWQQEFLDKVPLVPSDLDWSNPDEVMDVGLDILTITQQLAAPNKHIRNTYKKLYKNGKISVVIYKARNEEDNTKNYLIALIFNGSFPPDRRAEEEPAMQAREAIK